jgi:myosin heavy subunit
VYVLQVSYSTDNFLVKNRDFVVAEHQLMLEHSDETFIRALFPPEVDAEPAQVPFQLRMKSPW